MTALFFVVIFPLLPFSSEGRDQWNSNAPEPNINEKGSRPKEANVLQIPFSSSKNPSPSPTLLTGFSVASLLNFPKVNPVWTWGVDREDSKAIYLAWLNWFGAQGQDVSAVDDLIKYMHDEGFANRTPLLDEIANDGNWIVLSRMLNKGAIADMVETERVIKICAVAGGSPECAFMSAVQLMSPSTFAIGIKQLRSYDAQPANAIDIPLMKKLMLSETS